ncbi:hypothetical protein BDN72DRAFT_863903 [Pluteus cervinus]|uniref:Uncharacterized protein n=1 Tax=Pluteus cervinus TaxID=181527 RepID=A0ACD3A5U0_9AGAR|nr:hypothetical protein BDN72DRAFT_863903 [Pluteus cervinus]
MRSAHIQSLQPTTPLPDPSMTTSVILNFGSRYSFQAPVPIEIHLVTDGRRQSRQPNPFRLQHPKELTVHLVLRRCGSPQTREIPYRIGSRKARLKYEFEAVTYDTAVQGGILSGAEGTGDVVLVDVNPSLSGLTSLATWSSPTSRTQLITNTPS